MQKYCRCHSSCIRNLFSDYYPGGQTMIPVHHLKADMLSHPYRQLDTLDHMEAHKHQAQLLPVLPADEVSIWNALPVQDWKQNHKAELSDFQKKMEVVYKEYEMLAAGDTEAELKKAGFTLEGYEYCGNGKLDMVEWIYSDIQS